jgi:hypothetical protein
MAQNPAVGGRMRAGTRAGAQPAFRGGLAPERRRHDPFRLVPGFWRVASRLPRARRGLDKQVRTNAKDALERSMTCNRALMASITSQLHGFHP